LRQEDIDRIKRLAKTDEAVLRGAKTISDIMNGRCRSFRDDSRADEWAAQKQKLGQGLKND
jgi:hypothetical protein